jgi:hypothetical protein
MDRLEQSNPPSMWDVAYVIDMDYLLIISLLLVDPPGKQAGRLFAFGLQYWSFASSF